MEGHKESFVRQESGMILGESNKRNVKKKTLQDGMNAPILTQPTYASDMDMKWNPKV